MRKREFNEMNDFSSSEITDVEFDPRYSEIEFAILDYDNETDPLSSTDNNRNVNWHNIYEQSLELLKICFDLRVVLWSMRASLHIDGFSAFYKYTSDIDKKYSEERINIFPQADIDQNKDDGHATALGWLATASCLQEIKNSKIFPENVLTIDELLNIKNSEKESKDIHIFEIKKIINQANKYFEKKGIPSLKDQIISELSFVEHIENYANLHAENYKLDCHYIRDYLRMFLGFVNSMDSNFIVDEKETPEEVLEEVQEEYYNNKSFEHIRSRQDVILLLDKILDYFQNYEPSHPAPILLRRSQKMIGMNFSEIVEELLPESLNSLSNLSGKIN